MGIPTKSRKGKKAWRKNIDAKEVRFRFSLLLLLLPLLPAAATQPSLCVFLSSCLLLTLPLSILLLRASACIG